MDAQAPFGSEAPQAGPSESASPRPGAPLPSKDDRFWAAIAHLGGIPTFFIAPMVVWFMKREDSAFVDDQAKEAANFQFVVAIVMAALWVLPITNWFLRLLFCLAWLGSVVLALMASLRANQGAPHRYPVALRFVK